MSIFKTIKELQVMSMNTKMVQMASYGDLNLYRHKPKIMYPYVNLDVVQSETQNYSKKYTVRLYACDRNEPYIAYNKCEKILDSLLKSSNLDVSNYTTKFFNLDFGDQVNGAFVDAVIEVAMDFECRIEEEFVLTENLSGFIITEDGDFIIQE